ncbi:hypothetical protein C5S29_12370 [ANME-1 cluster archaeon GoMg3.2]|nr:hypothetical protein [ANME-1 cluster archaeon GoMg3.2]
MSANEIERIKEEISGIDRLIELEKERTPAWLEILDVMKSGLEMNSMLNGRIIALGKRLDELEGKALISKDELVSKLAKLLGKTPEDIPPEDLEKLETTMGIFRLLPKDKFEIRDSPFKDEYITLKDFINQKMIDIENETGKKSNELNERIIKVDKRLDELEGKALISKDELVSKLAKLLGKTPEDIPPEDLEKLETTMGIFRLLPKDKFEIRDSPFKDEYITLKDFINQKMIDIENETHKRLKR